MTLLEKIAEFGHAVSLRADDEANRLYDEIAAALSAQARASEAEDAAMRMFWDDQPLEDKNHYRNVVCESQGDAGSRGEA